MQTKEFIKEVEVLGFEVKDFEGAVHVRIDGEMLLAISKRYEGVLDTDYANFRSLSWVFRKPVFKLAVEYASTPVDKREEEKEYYIKLIGTAGWCDCIAYNEKENHYFMSPSYEYLGYKTKFTLKQIKEYGLPNFADSDLFELVEVE